MKFLNLFTVIALSAMLLFQVYTIPPAYAPTGVEEGTVVAIALFLIAEIQAAIKSFGTASVVAKTKILGPDTDDIKIGYDFDKDNGLDWSLDATARAEALNNRDDGTEVPYTAGDEHYSYLEIHFESTDGQWAPDHEDFYGIGDQEFWGWATAKPDDDPVEEDITIAVGAAAFSADGTNTDFCYSAATNSTTGHVSAERTSCSPMPDFKITEGKIYMLNENMFSFEDQPSGKVLVTPRSQERVDLFHDYIQTKDNNLVFPVLRGYDSNVQELKRENYQEHFRGSPYVMSEDPNDLADLTIVGAALDFKPVVLERNGLNNSELLEEYFRSGAVTVVAPQHAQKNYKPDVEMMEVVKSGQDVSALTGRNYTIPLNGDPLAGNQEPLTGLMVVVKGDIDESVELALNTEGSFADDLAKASGGGGGGSVDIKIEQSTFHYENSNELVDYTTASPELIPSWVKTNALWWSDNLIDDQTFALAIGYLVQENIIKVGSEKVDPQGSLKVSDALAIPDWIQNNAKWWAEDRITDDDFKEGIQFMVNEDIISFDAAPAAISISNAPTPDNPRVLECRNGVWHIVIYDMSNPEEPKEESVIPTELACGTSDIPRTLTGTAGKVLMTQNICRDGFWHVVTFDITNPDNPIEISDIATNQKCEPQAKIQPTDPTQVTKLECINDQYYLVDYFVYPDGFVRQIGNLRATGVACEAAPQASSNVSVMPDSQVKCGPGTVLKDGTCVIETKCGPGTVLKNGVCVVEEKPPKETPPVQQESPYASYVEIDNVSFNPTNEQDVEGHNLVYVSFDLSGPQDKLFPIIKLLVTDPYELPWEQKLQGLEPGFHEIPIAMQYDFEYDEGVFNVQFTTESQDTALVGDTSVDFVHPPEYEPSEEEMSQTVNVMVGESWADVTNYDGWSQVKSNWIVYDSQSKPISNAKITVKVTTPDNKQLVSTGITGTSGLVTLSNDVIPTGLYKFDVIGIQSQSPGVNLAFSSTSAASLSMQVIR